MDVLGGELTLEHSSQVRFKAEQNVAHIRASITAMISNQDADNAAQVDAPHTPNPQPRTPNPTPTTIISRPNHELPHPKRINPYPSS